MVKGEALMVVEGAVVVDEVYEVVMGGRIDTVDD